MFWKNFEKLCTFKGISPNGVCKELGLSNAAATHWKQGAKPNNSTLKRIADYFGVTPESLLAENEQKKDPAQMSREEKLSYIMQKYFQMSDEERKSLEQFADYLLEKREKKSPDNSTGQ